MTVLDRILIFLLRLLKRRTRDITRAQNLVEQAWYSPFTRALVRETHAALDREEWTVAAALIKRLEQDGDMGLNDPILTGLRTDLALLGPGQGS